MLRSSLALSVILLLVPVAHAHDLESIDRLSRESVYEAGIREAMRHLQTRILLHIAAKDGVDVAKRLLSESRKSTAEAMRLMVQAGGAGTPLKDPDDSLILGKGADYHFKILEMTIEFMEKRAKNK